MASKKKVEKKVEKEIEIPNPLDAMMDLLSGKVFDALDEITATDDNDDSEEDSNGNDETDTGGKKPGRPAKQRAEPAASRVEFVHILKQPDDKPSKRSNGTSPGPDGKKAGETPGEQEQAED